MLFRSGGGAGPAGHRGSADGGVQADGVLPTAVTAGAVGAVHPGAVPRAHVAQQTVTRSQCQFGNRVGQSHDAIFRTPSHYQCTAAVLQQFLEHDQLTVLDVQGFPIRRSWYVVYPAGKRLSVVAKTFFDYLKQEAFTIQEELSGPPPRAGKKKPR